MGEPVLIVHGPATDTPWGVCQFPDMWRGCDGAVYLCVNMGLTVTWPARKTVVGPAESEILARPDEVRHGTLGDSPETSCPIPTWYQRGRIVFHRL